MVGGEITECYIFPSSYNRHIWFDKDQFGKKKKDYFAKY